MMTGLRGSMNWTRIIRAQEGKNGLLTLIELTLLPCRSNELKKAVFNEITRLLNERLHIQATDIIIIMHEPPLDNWGCYDEHASDLNMIYKLE